MFEILVAQLLTWSLKIKNQTQPKGNTETLVGGLFEQIVQLIKQLIAVIVNLSIGWLWKEPVDTKADLATKYPNPSKGWACLVRDENYIYCYDGSKWINTGIIGFPTDAATKEDIDSVLDEVERVISNSLCKYDIIADANGWVLSYKTALESSTILRNDVYLNMNIVTDANGFVKSGTDWKNRQLALLEITDTIPSIYNLTTDVNGFVSGFYKETSIPDLSNLEKNPDKLSDSFTKEVPIVQGEAHYGFPGICSGKTGILHAFYRKGLYHTGIDGDVMYSYSKDFGKTWSDGVLALKGGDETSDGWFGDWRDCKAIRMSNGMFLLSQSKNYAKENNGTPPYHVDYDTENKCRSYAIIYDSLSNGILDIANPKIVEMPNPTGSTWGFGAGGLLEHDKIIYMTVYSNVPNSTYLFKSLDFGLTWEMVSKIQDGYNESTIAFIGETMFCIMRNISVNARIVKSDDLGKTWTLVKDLGYYFHGMYALGLGDTIMIAGRHYYSKTNVVFIDKNGNYVLEPVILGAGGDSSYADICVFENYVHIIYYSQSSATNWGIFTRKVERCKVLGLSY